MPGMKTLRGHVTIWAARPEAFTDEEWRQPLSAAKFNEMVAKGLIEDISCAVEDGYTLNGTSYTTSTSQSVCDVTSVESPQFKQYEASLDLFRNKPGTLDTPIYDRARAWFDAPYIPVRLIKRVDVKQGEPVKAGDTLSAFGFTTDFPTDIVADNADIMHGARFKPDGFHATNIDAAA